MSRDGAYLRHILDAAQRVESYVSVGRETFFSTPHWQDAVIRQLEVVGEATKGLSIDIRKKHPRIPWRRMAGLRDVLIHNYMGVDLNAVWSITQKEIPILRRDIAAIIETLDKGD